MGEGVKGIGPEGAPDVGEFLKIEQMKNFKIQLKFIFVVRGAESPIFEKNFKTKRKFQLSGFERSISNIIFHKEDFYRHFRKA